MEINTRAAQLFEDRFTALHETADKNRSGGVDFDEMLAIDGPFRASADSAKLQEAFAQADVDGDGELSVSEGIGFVQQKLEGMFKSGGMPAGMLEMLQQFEDGDAEDVAAHETDTATQASGFNALFLTAEDIAPGTLREFLSFRPENSDMLDGLFA